ncbi:MAG: hypothetical protein WA005_02840 [Candidatus Binataceae bacterium]
MGKVWLFLYRRVLPLLDERNINNDPIRGCGCLLRVGSRTFFVTAAHVFDRLVPAGFEHIGVPVGPYETTVTTLGPGAIHRTNQTATADIDVGIFPLSDEVVAKLKWDCLTVKNLAALRPVSAMNEFLIFGYPNSLVLPAADDLVRANPAFLRTSRYFGPTPQHDKRHDDVDLILAYGDKAIDGNGNEVEAPSLPGISGSPIWAVMPSGGSLWSPESALVVVAIDSAWTKKGVKDRYVVSKLWTAVLRAFEQVDADAAREIKDALYL